MFNFKKAGITIAAAYGAAYALKSASVDLKHFKLSEFGVWFPFIDTDLLNGLDEFRDVLGAPVSISPVKGAIGRTNKEAKNSQHYLPASGKVRAIDVMIPQEVSLAQAYNVARSLGVFSGIGVYPDWLPTHGLHLDTRVNKSPDNPATWSGIKVAGVQVYRSIEEGLA